MCLASIRPIDSRRRLLGPRHRLRQLRAHDHAAGEHRLERHQGHLPDAPV